MSPCNCKPPFAHPVSVYMFTCIALCWKVTGLGFTFICVSCPPRTVSSTFAHSILIAILPASIYEHRGSSVGASCQVCLKHALLSMEPIRPKVPSPRDQVSETNWHHGLMKSPCVGRDDGWGAADVRNNESSRSEKNRKMVWRTNLTPFPSYLIRVTYSENGVTGKRFYRRWELDKRKAAFLCYPLLLCCLPNKNVFVMDMFRDGNFFRIIMSIISTGVWRSLTIILLIAAFRVDDGR